MGSRLKPKMAAARIANSLVTKSTNLVKGTVAFGQPRLATFWKYAKVELRPPSLNEMPQVSQGFNNLLASARSGKWKQLTIKEATVNTLVGVEVLMWFFIGECIGKRALVGYQIPGACHFDVEF